MSANASSFFGAVVAEDELAVALAPLVMSPQMSSPPKPPPPKEEVVVVAVVVVGACGRDCCAEVGAPQTSCVLNRPLLLCV